MLSTNLSLKDKTITGIKWSFVDSFANQGMQFVIGIILARLLTPKEFGLIGIITIVIAISQTFVDSGFSQALIRKNDCRREDYSTAFYFNLSVKLFQRTTAFSFDSCFGHHSCYQLRRTDPENDSHKTN
jgi:O-antigen/teichoic acid export membrane protein